jgi:four helix bundle protein
MSQRDDASNQGDDSRKENAEHRDLRARTKAFALRIVRMYCALPKLPQAQVLGKQVLRSGTSPGAQYREAYRARSNAECVSKIQSALQELDETCYWLDLLVDGGVLPKRRLAALQAEAEELTAIFTSIAIKAKARKKQL